MQGQGTYKKTEEKMSVHLIVDGTRKKWMSVPWSEEEEADEFFDQPLSEHK